MNAKLCRRGHWARKPVPRGKAEDARQIVWRTRKLVDFGLATPLCRFEPATSDLLFPWIDGLTGDQILAETLIGAGEQVPGAVLDKLWRSLLHPLKQLHAIDPQDLRLSPLNPWRRIDPRIARLRHGSPLEGDLNKKVTDIRKVCETTLAAATAAGKNLPQKTVHGDYHLRQVLFANKDRRAWLLDLDDLAAGSPESDLGNFAAHLITAGLFSPRPSAALYFKVARRVQRAYEADTKVALEAAMLDSYGAVALLRRALKFQARGDDAASINAALETAAEVTARIGAQCR